MNLFLYFSLNDYFRFAVEWLPHLAAVTIIGYLTAKALTRVEGGRPMNAASAKHWVFQMIAIVGVAILATALSFLIPYPREMVYEAWAIGAPVLWWLLLIWYIREPKLIHNWTRTWLMAVHWFPAFAISVFFFGLSAGQVAAHSDSFAADGVQIILKSAEPANGKILFLLDDYILLRGQQGTGIIVLPKTDVTKIIYPTNPVARDRAGVAD